MSTLNEIKKCSTVSLATKASVFLTAMFLAFATSNAAIGSELTPTNNGVVAFQASAECHPMIVATSLWRCNAISASVATEEPSPTDLSLVTSAPFSNMISYSFDCESSKPLISNLQLGGADLAIAQSSAPSLITTPLFSVPYTGSSYTFTVAPPDANTMLDSACALIIYPSITIPPIELLGTYADNLITSINNTTSTISSLDDASAFPDKWAIVQAMPDTLVNEANGQTSSCRTLGASAASLVKIDKSVRTPDQTQQLMTLIGSDTTTIALDPRVLCPYYLTSNIESIPPDFCASATTKQSVSAPALGGKLGQVIATRQQLICLARDVHAGLPTTIACGTDGTSTECAKSVIDAEQKFTSYRNAVAAEAFKLLGFIKAEEARLAGRATDTRSKLTEIVSSLSTAGIQ